MSDTYAARSEVRFLEEKRMAGGLTPEEDFRLQTLLQQLGMPASAEPLASDDASAGWSTPAAGDASPAPDAAYAAQGYDPAYTQPYDPASQQAYAYDPAAQQAYGYDPAAQQAYGYEPTAQQALAYDPAAQQAYGYDPATHQASAYDPAAHQALAYDPAAQQAYGYGAADPHAFAYDPAAHPAPAYDPALQQAQAYDPATQQAYAFDPATQQAYAFDPATQQAYGYAPGTQEAYAYDPATQQAYGYAPGTQEAYAYDPAAQQTYGYEPATQQAHAYDPATQQAWAYTPATQQAHAYDPATQQAWAYEPATQQAHAYDPATQQAWAYTPATQQAHAYDPAAQQAYAAPGDEPYAAQTYLQGDATQQGSGSVHAPHGEDADAAQAHGTSEVPAGGATALDELALVAQGEVGTTPDALTSSMPVAVEEQLDLGGEVDLPSLQETPPWMQEAAPAPVVQLEAPGADDELQFDAIGPSTSEEPAAAHLPLPAETAAMSQGFEPVAEADTVGGFDPTPATETAAEPAWASPAMPDELDAHGPVTEEPAWATLDAVPPLTEASSGPHAEAFFTQPAEAGAVGLELGTAGAEPLGFAAPVEATAALDFAEPVDGTAPASEHAWGGPEVSFAAPAEQPLPADAGFDATGWSAEVPVQEELPALADGAPLALETAPAVELSPDTWDAGALPLDGHAAEPPAPEWTEVSDVDTAEAVPPSAAVHGEIELAEDAQLLALYGQSEASTHAAPDAARVSEEAAFAEEPWTWASPEAQPLPLPAEQAPAPAWADAPAPGWAGAPGTDGAEAGSPAVAHEPPPLEWEAVPASEAAAFAASPTWEEAPAEASSPVWEAAPALPAASEVAAPVWTETPAGAPEAGWSDSPVAEVPVTPAVAVELDLFALPGEQAGQAPLQAGALPATDDTWAALGSPGDLPVEWEDPSAEAALPAPEFQPAARESMFGQAPTGGWEEEASAVELSADDFVPVEVPAQTEVPAPAELELEVEEAPLEQPLAAPRPDVAPALALERVSLGGVEADVLEVSMEDVAEAAAQPVLAASAPIEEIELDGAADEAVPLASNSDFIEARTYAERATDVALELPAEEFAVDNGPLADLAQQPTWAAPLSQAPAPLEAAPALELPEIELVEDMETIELEAEAEPEPAAPAQVVAVPAAATANLHVGHGAQVHPPAAVLMPPAPAPMAHARAPEPAVAAMPLPQAAPGAPAAVEDFGFDIDVPEARASFIAGEHRVILHTVEGQVKRGILRDVDLEAGIIPLEQQTGLAPERISTQRVKAVFFMLPPGQRQPPAAGQKVRVTFHDGRQLAGFSTDHRQPAPGFFLVPADNRTNTERIYIFRSAVQTVAEG